MGAGEPQGERSLLELVTLAVRRRRLLVGLPLVAMIAALLLSFVLPHEYTVQSRFMPEATQAQASRMAGLASQFGIDIGGDNTESVVFYQELLSSGEVLRAAALTNYAFPRRETGSDTIRGNLVELLHADGDTPDERIKNAIEQLRELVAALPDRESQIVTLRTSAPWPALSVELNQRLLALVNEFNLDRRQSRAAAERKFLQGRVDSAGAELRAAEVALERFLTENRRYEESPQLRFEFNRLQRRATFTQDLYTSLSQSFEQARVDEVRNTPVITVLDQPRPPAEQTSPNPMMNGLLGLVLGALLAFGIVIAQELLGGARAAHPARYRELRAALSDAVPGRRRSASAEPPREREAEGEYAVEAADRPRSVPGTFKG